MNEAVRAPFPIESKPRINNVVDIKQRPDRNRFISCPTSENNRYRTARLVGNGNGRKTTVAVGQWQSNAADRSPGPRPADWQPSSAVIVHKRPSRPPRLACRWCPSIHQPANQCCPAVSKPMPSPHGNSPPLFRFVPPPLPSRFSYTKSFVQHPAKSRLNSRARFLFHSICTLLGPENFVLCSLFRVFSILHQNHISFTYGPKTLLYRTKCRPALACSCNGRRNRSLILSDHCR